MNDKGMEFVKESIRGMNKKESIVIKCFLDGYLELFR